ncbi:nuclear transport factor 2 family protein [Pseudonocardia pini]|uniref:nuclear transport factor 2 family protein n=1 Tax=Pseudonocardia pini TaxID=2758030 RepID=UPI0015F0A94E|nr:nuclear transport factor 2 family protein [Pseudonocardia pini]
MTGQALARDVEARLRRFEDLAEIGRLVTAYCTLLDRGELAAFAGLFADDGELDLGPAGRAAGRAGIEDLMRRTLPPVGGVAHVPAAPSVEIDGDTARGEVMWTVVTAAREGRAPAIAVGLHRDRYVRSEGRWRFRSRVASRIVAAPLGG